MKNLIILSIFTVFTLALFPAGQEPPQTKIKSHEINYTAGLNFTYNRALVSMDDEIENMLIYSYLALEVDVELSDYIKLGVLAGYAKNQFDDPVDFLTLPLSLRVSDQSYNSMIFGARIKSDFFSWRDFSFSANGEILFCKLFEKEDTIDLPIVSGTSSVKQSFSQMSLELLAQYDGFSNFTIFAGPQLYLLKGKITASESIEELQGEEEFEYKQKNSLGFTGGINLELGSHFDIDIKLSLFSRTSLSIEIFYIF
jgi:hypothetical protein